MAVTKEDAEEGPNRMDMETPLWRRLTGEARRRKRLQVHNNKYL